MTSALHLLLTLSSMKKTILYICAAFILGCLPGMNAGAQTKFVISNVSPDYPSYVYLEDCLAAASRINMLPRVQRSIVDTFQYIRKPSNRAISQEAKDTGQICMQKWNLDTISVHLIKQWARGLLTVGYEPGEVKRLYSKYLDSIPTSEVFNAKMQWLGLLNLVMEESLVPFYLKEREELTRSIPEDSIGWRFGNLSGAVGMWVEFGDLQRASDALDDLNKFMEKNKDNRIVQAVLPIMTRMWPTIEVVREDDLMKQLAISTESYFKMLDSLREAFSPFTDISAINKTVATVDGKYWYNKSGTGKVDLVNSPMVRPVNDRVNILVFLQGGCHTSSFLIPSPVVRSNISGGGSCRGIAAVLNRVKHDFPAVEITIASRTFGSFGSAPPLAPTDEAATLANYFLNFYKIDAAVAVEETDYTNLPGFDKRRIDFPTENDSRFTIENRLLATTGHVIISDRQGKIVHSGSIHDFWEVGVRKKIETVLKR